MQSPPRATENVDPPQVATNDLSTSPTSTLSPPGILTVTLHKAEGVGLSAPDRYKQRRGRTGHIPNQPYAVVEYGKCQAVVKSRWGTVECPAWSSHWNPEWGTRKFDVSRFVELTIFLYLKDRVTGWGEIPRDVFLGAARMPLVDGLRSRGPQWLDIQDGTGRIQISLHHHGFDAKQLDLSSFFPDLRFEGRSKKEDTQQTYFTKRVPADAATRSAYGQRIISHPFIAHLMFSLPAANSGDLYLLSPLVSGGFLFDHLQHDRCFQLERARLYVAEMVCALEYLHGVHKVFDWLKPRNVLLDSVGHVVLCGFGYFMAPGIAPGAPEYPAPEVLRGQAINSRTADWWTLGIFLYEMLTGLLPFYDADHDEVRRQILGNEPVPFPDLLPAIAKDFITKLLNRRPEQRLGADGGASQIKAHSFFDGIDWHMVVRRKYQPAFKPGFVAESHFTQHGATTPRPPSPAPFVRKRPAHSQTTMTRSGCDEVMATEHSASRAIKKQTSQKLIWEPVPAEFCIYNPVTQSRELVNPAGAADNGSAKDADATAIDVGYADPCVPSQRQKQDVLEVALRAGYDDLVAQLLEEYGGMDLNTCISVGDPLRPTQTSPPAYITEQEEVDMARLFLAHGADVNYSNPLGRYITVPLLVKAVEKGNRVLAALLVGKTTRIACTRALGRAVGRQDTAMAALLLDHGGRPDFEVDDPPEPRHPDDMSQDWVVSSKPDAFVPPLVRAVKHRDDGLVHLLLTHGANPDVGYHDLHVEHVENWVHEDGYEVLRWPQPPSDAELFRCGRVVELAVALREPNIVRLLLAAGANIGLAHPVWNVKGHSCWWVPRDVYQRVVAGLRAAVREYREETKSDSGSALSVLA